MTAKTHTQHFRYDDLSFRVQSPARSHLRWLEQFLVPHFDVGRGEGKEIVVDLRIDRHAFRQARDRFPTDRSAAAFMFDSRVEKLASRDCDDGGLLIYDEYFETFFTVDRNRRHVTVLIGEDTLTVRTPLMRILREYAMNEALGSGDIFLHASCFTHRGRSVVVTGPKRSGKTTLLMYACLSGGVACLANDRVRVRRKDGGHIIRGVPSIVSIREKSFEFFPRAGADLEKMELHFRLNDEESLQGTGVNRAADGGSRFLITPSQFCDLLKTRQVPIGERPLVVVPRITGETGTFSIRRIDGPEARTLLQESLFGARHWASSTPVFNADAGRAGVDRAMLEENCHSFVDATPVFICEVGLDLYKGRDNFDRLMGRLFSEAAS
jgi:hypothetical protein